MKCEYPYVRYEVSDERRRYDTGNGTDPVDQSHRGTRVIRTQVHNVHFHAGIKKSHGGHTHREQNHHLYLIAARVRRRQRTQHGSDTS